MLAVDFVVSVVAAGAECGYVKVYVALANTASELEVSALFDLAIVHRQHSVSIVGAVLVVSEDTHVQSVECPVVMGVMWKFSFIN